MRVHRPASKLAGFDEQRRLHTPHQGKGVKLLFDRASKTPLTIRRLGIQQLEPYQVSKPSRIRPSTRPPQLLGRLRNSCYSCTVLTIAHLEAASIALPSVGMTEHEEVVNYDAFFRVIQTSLHNDGMALFRHIDHSDGNGTTSQWLPKCIFSGDYSPALSEVLPAIRWPG